MALTALFNRGSSYPLHTAPRARSPLQFRRSFAALAFSKRNSSDKGGPADSSLGRKNFRVVPLRPQLVGKFWASTSENTFSSDEDGPPDEMFKEWKADTTNSGISFLAKLAIGLGLAATATIISLCLKNPTSESASGVRFLINGSPDAMSAASSNGFTLSIFQYTIVLPQYAPGWVYFWLLMAAGCGLFISEEALNIWVCPLHWLAHPWLER